MCKQREVAIKRGLLAVIVCLTIGLQIFGGYVYFNGQKEQPVFQELIPVQEEIRPYYQYASQWLLRQDLEEAAQQHPGMSIDFIDSGFSEITPEGRRPVSTILTFKGTQSLLLESLEALMTEREKLEIEAVEMRLQENIMFVTCSFYMQEVADA